MMQVRHWRLIGFRYGPFFLNPGYKEQFWADVEGTPHCPNLLDHYSILIEAVPYASQILPQLRPAAEPDR